MLLNFVPQFCKTVCFFTVGVVGAIINLYEFDVSRQEITDLIEKPIGKRLMRRTRIKRRSGSNPRGSQTISLKLKLRDLVFLN